MQPIVPKREKGPDEDSAGKTRSIWASDSLWEELQHAAKREGYSVSKFVGFLLRGGLETYKRQRALEAGKSASDEKP